MMKGLCTFCCRVMSKLQVLDFIPLLALRIYLVPVFWFAGMNKLTHVAGTAAWFGDANWGLGLPFPHAMVYLSGGAEVLGAVLLAVGLGVRLISVPLIVVMCVAISWVHWDHGWHAVATQGADSTVRLQAFLTWLKTVHPGRHNFITELGSPVMLNNGIEFATTYLIMLLTLFFYGAGRYFSLDYWLVRFVCPRKKP